VNGTFAYRINASGQIVGFYFDSNFSRHGFLLSGGQYTTLDDPNGGSGRGQGTTVIGINGAGTVVGIFTDSNSQQHAFLATPTNSNFVSDGAPTGLAGSGKGENSSPPNFLLINAMPPAGASSAQAGESATRVGDGSNVAASGDSGIGSLVLGTPARIQATHVGTDGGNAQQPVWDVLGDVDVLSFDPWNVSPAATLVH
jgi:probable HAF family extracellular repeat protein